MERTKLHRYGEAPSSAIGGHGKMQTTASTLRLLANGTKRHERQRLTYVRFHASLVDGNLNRQRSPYQTTTDRDFKEIRFRVHC